MPLWTGGQGFVRSALHVMVVGLPYPRWPARVGRGTGYRVNEIAQVSTRWVYKCRDFSSRSTIIIYKYIYHYLGLLKPCIYANTYIITRRVFTRLRDYNQYGRFPMQFIW